MKLFKQARYINQMGLTNKTPSIIKQAPDSGALDILPATCTCNPGPRR